MKKTDSVSESLVIGLGEVGTAIASILGCDGIDKGQTARHKSYKFLHICFPYTDEFIRFVKSYQFQYSPDFIIVHSTVPVGTCKQINAVHSPVTGRHPDLVEGIKTFTKFFGGQDAFICSDLFREKGIKTKCYARSEITEAMKLISTTYFGLNVMIEKEIYAWCERNDLPFKEVYSTNNEDYNRGYTELHCPQFVRPNLEHIAGEIKGHCIINNLDLIKDFPLAELLKEKNKEYAKV